ncbi:hypothetical protein OSB04_029031 [Centaurea solstitialis]|uniref:Uncharacterized protein n=1 Tax=Centaurea solstitialis TaxID=347529 RepID=A0AA38W8B5_9ASTR|nr:hypothetical protein OSB04_029031 [Centaurea solstitialis]
MKLLKEANINWAWASKPTKSAQQQGGIKNQQHKIGVKNNTYQERYLVFTYHYYLLRDDSSSRCILAPGSIFQLNLTVHSSLFVFSLYSNRDRQGKTRFTYQKVQARRSLYIKCCLSRNNFLNPDGGGVLAKGMRDVNIPSTRQYVLGGGKGNPEVGLNTTSLKTLESCAIPSHPAQTNVGDEREYLLRKEVGLVLDHTSEVTLEGFGTVAVGPQDPTPVEATPSNSCIQSSGKGRGVD